MKTMYYTKGYVTLPFITCIVTMSFSGDLYMPHNILRPWQNACHPAKGILNSISLMKIALKYVSNMTLHMEYIYYIYIYIQWINTVPPLDFRQPTEDHRRGGSSTVSATVLLKTFYEAQYIHLCHHMPGLCLHGDKSQYMRAAMILARCWEDCTQD